MEWIEELCCEIPVGLLELLKRFHECTLVAAELQLFCCPTKTIGDDFRLMRIPEEEIGLFLNEWRKLPPPQVNDIDFRNPIGGRLEGFSALVIELLASRLPPGFVANHRESLLDFINKKGRNTLLDDYRQDTDRLDWRIAKCFIRRTAFDKLGPVVENHGRGKFYVTRLKALTSPPFLSRSVPIEFINSEPLTVPYFGRLLWLSG